MKYIKILFENGKILVLKNDKIAPIVEFEEFDDDPDEFNSLYDCEVSFAKDLTVGGFLRALYPFVKTIEYHFSSFLGDNELQQYFDLLDLPYQPAEGEDDVSDKIEYIEMYWSAEIFEFEDILNNKVTSEFSKWGSYHGVSQNINFSMSLSPINNWQHYNFKLNDDLVCWKNNREGSGVFMDSVFISTYKWNLHDLLRWFFYELTFFGSVTDQENLSNRLSQQIEDIESGDVTFHTFSLEEMELQSLENLLNEAVETENYEGAARIRNKINEIKEKKKRDSQP